MAYDIQLEACFSHVGSDSNGMVLEILLLESGELLKDFRWKVGKFKSYSPSQITHNFCSIVHIGHEAALVADQRKVMNECSIVISVSVVVNIQPFLLHFPGHNINLNQSQDFVCKSINNKYIERDAL